VVSSNGGAFANKSVDGGTHGFLIVRSSRDSFTSNVVKGSYYGFYLLESDGATIVGNEVSDCRYAVFSWFSEAEVRDNILANNEVNVFTFDAQTVLIMLLILTSWSNRAAFDQTAIMAPIFFAAFVTYPRAGERVKGRRKVLGAAGALLFVAAITLLPFCSVESGNAGFNVALLFILYFAQSTTPLFSNIYPTPATYFSGSLYRFPLYAPSFLYLVKGFDAYLKYSLLVGVSFQRAHYL